MNNEPRLIDPELVDQVLGHWCKRTEYHKSMPLPQQVITLQKLKEVMAHWQDWSEQEFQFNMNDAMSYHRSRMSYLEYQYLKTCGSWMNMILLSYHIDPEVGLCVRNTIAQDLFR